MSIFSLVRREDNICPVERKFSLVARSSLPYVCNYRNSSDNFSRSRFSSLFVGVTLTRSIVRINVLSGDLIQPHFCIRESTRLELDKKIFISPFLMVILGIVDFLSRARDKEISYFTIKLLYKINYDRSKKICQSKLNMY